MNKTIDITKFIVPLSIEAHKIAQDCSVSMSNVAKVKKVYQNTLAIYAVESYLRLMGFQTDWSSSDSRDPFLIHMMDVADLKINNVGRIECRPVEIGMDHCDVPIEVPENRIGYVIVQLDPNLREATILGFYPNSKTQIRLQDLKTIDDLLNILSDLEKRQYPFERVLSDWIVHYQMETIQGWQKLSSLFGTEQQLASQLLHPQEEKEIQRGKLFTLDIDIQQQSLALVLVVTPEADNKMAVRIRVRPEKEKDFLPPGLMLSLLAENEEILQEIQANAKDNWVQLPRFRGDQGERFYVRVSLGEANMTEAFIF